MKPNTYTSILALFCAATTAHANLILDPGFENNPLNTYLNVLSNFALNQGQWGAEAATITLATGGATPPEGTRMLSMTGSGGSYQTDQVTNVVGLYSAGDSVTFSAFFNTPTGVSSAVCGVSITFLSGPNYNTDKIGSLISNGLTLDGNANTWQLNSVSTLIPALTQWIASEVLYTANAALGSNPGFVDAASLTIVPEPGSTVLFSVACVGIAAFRRRRNA